MTTRIVWLDHTKHDFLLAQAKAGKDTIEWREHYADLYEEIQYLRQRVQDLSGNEDRLQEKCDGVRRELKVAQAKATFMQSLAEESKKRADAALGADGKSSLEAIEEIVAWTAQYDSESDEMDAGRGAEIMERICKAAQAATVAIGLLVGQLQAARNRAESLQGELDRATRECDEALAVNCNTTTVAQIGTVAESLAGELGHRVALTLDSQRDPEVDYLSRDRWRWAVWHHGVCDIGEVKGTLPELVAAVRTWWAKRSGNTTSVNYVKAKEAIQKATESEAAFRTSQEATEAASVIDLQHDPLTVEV